MELSQLYNLQRIGGRWSALSAGGLTLIAFANFIIISRLIGPEAFGLMAMVNASLALAISVLRQSPAESLVQVSDLDDESIDTMFWTLQGVAIAAVGLVFALRRPIAELFGEAELPDLLLATSVTIPLAALGAVPLALWRRELRLDLISKILLVSELAGSFSSLGLALAGFGVWSLVWSQVLTRCLECYFLWRHVDWRPGLRWSWTRLARLGVLSGSHAAVISLNVLDRHLARALLGSVYGAVVLGHFFFAVRVIEVLERLALSPVRQLAMPSFSRLQDRPVAARRYYAQGLAMTSSLVLPIFGGVALSAPLLIPAVAGSDWSPAAPLAQVLAVASLTLVYSTWNSALLRGRGKQPLVLGLRIFRTVLSVSLIIAWLQYGPLGVAAALLAARWLTEPLAAWLVAREARLPLLVQARALAPSAAATVIMALALFALEPAFSGLPTGAAGAATVGLGAAIYFLALLLIDPRQVRSLYRVARNRTADREGPPGSVAADSRSGG